MEMKIFNSRAEYFASDETNYSLLKAVEANPTALTYKHNPEGEALEFGSAVDTLLFDGEEVFKKEVVQDTVDKKPTASTLTLANAYVKHFIGFIPKAFKRDEDLALAIAEELGLWSKNSNDVILKKLDSTFWGYVEFNILYQGKFVFDSATYNDIINSVESIKDGKFTANYLYGSDNIQALGQLAFAFAYNYKGREVACKCMLDLVSINHKNKTVMPVDLKTTAKSAKRASFTKSIVEYRYDLQAELYSYGIKQWCNINYPGYIVLPFRWIVLSRLNIQKPLVYRCGSISKWRDEYNRKNTATLRSLETIMGDYLFYKDTEQSEYTREMYEKGYLDLI